VYKTSKTSPAAPDSAPGMRGLWCRHVSPRLKTRSRCQSALALPRAPWHRGLHPPGEGSGVTTCSEASSTPPARRGLQCRHVPRGTKPVTLQERALESPCVSWLQARPLRSKALASSRDRGIRTTAQQGFGIAMCYVAPDLPPGVGGLWSRHVPYGPRPPGHARAFPRRTLNGYVTLTQQDGDSTVQTYWSRATGKQQ
jgi:hypothetical protein